VQVRGLFGVAYFTQLGLPLPFGHRSCRESSV